ncbi:MAG: polysaccharide deacetylase family protein [Eubacteriaceae bacterium]|nr:polysaccharide deacetylase family protein [Eubacteriaceae bacterium]
MKHIRSFAAFFIFSLLVCLSLAEGSDPVATAAEKKDADVPILMYHGLTDVQSHVNDYFIPASTFEADLKYLSEKGYTAITMSQLIGFVHDNDNTVSLPDKPVIITFDDGYYNNHEFATPLLKKYNMKAVISVIGEACQQAVDEEYSSDAYRNLTWDELSEMSRSGYWEVENHTWNMHHIDTTRKGAAQNPGEDDEVYARLLKANLMPLQEKIKECTGTVPNTFTWPYGIYTNGSKELLKDMGFQAGLLCASGVNHLTKGDADTLFGLKRGLRTPTVPLEKLLQ